MRWEEPVGCIFSFIKKGGNVYTRTCLLLLDCRTKFYKPRFWKLGFLINFCVGEVVRFFSIYFLHQIPIYLICKLEFGVRFHYFTLFFVMRNMIIKTDKTDNYEQVKISNKIWLLNKMYTIILMCSSFKIVHTYI